MTDRESIYQSLRGIGFSPENADACAEVMIQWPEKWRIAKYLELKGYTQEEIGGAIGCCHQYVSRILKAVAKRS